MPHSFNVIHPKLPSLPSVRGYLLNALRKAGDAIQTDMEATTQTWKHQPVFHRFMGYKGGNVNVIVYTDDEAWNWLNNGTLVRYAIMSNPFQPKTKSRWIGSGPGVGKAVVRGKTNMKHGMPGIEPREWTDVISQKNQPLFEQLIYDATVKGLLK